MRRSAFFLALVLGACSRKAEPQRLTSAELPPTNDQLAVRVDQRLGSEVSLAARDVAVSVDDGVATLRGTVSSDDERHTIHVVAESTPGITRLVDDLTVSSDGPPRDDADRTIAANALRAARAEPSLRDVVDRLELKSTGGIVTIRRDLLDDAQRRAATRAIEAVPGVIVVTDAPR